MRPGGKVLSLRSLTMSASRLDMPVSDDMALLQPIAYPIDIRLALPPAAAVLMEVDTSSRSQLRQ